MGRPPLFTLGLLLTSATQWRRRRAEADDFSRVRFHRQHCGRLVETNQGNRPRRLDAQRRFEPLSHRSPFALKSNASACRIRLQGSLDGRAISVKGSLHSLRSKRASSIHPEFNRGPKRIVWPDRRFRHSSWTASTTPGRTRTRMPGATRVSQFMVRAKMTVSPQSSTAMMIDRVGSPRSRSCRSVVSRRFWANAP